MNDTPFEHYQQFTTGAPSPSGWRTALDNVSRATWGRIVLAAVAIHLIVNVVLIVPVITALMTILAAAWVTSCTDPNDAPREGAVLGGVVAVTGLVVFGWFGLTALAWCGITVAAGWLGGRMSGRLRPHLPGPLANWPPPSKPKGSTPNRPAWAAAFDRPTASQPAPPAPPAEPAPPHPASPSTAESAPTQPVWPPPATEQPGNRPPWGMSGEPMSGA